MLGAWLGRCAGCNLGKPVEGWSRERIRRYLDLADAYPIDDYLPVVDPFPDGLQLNWCWPETTRGNIAFMARDDDTDYTILGLHILEDARLRVRTRATSPRNGWTISPSPRSTRRSGPPTAT